MVIDLRSRPRSAFPRPTRTRTTPASFARTWGADEWSTISCDDCVMEGTDACRDCVVTHLCADDPGAQAGAMATATLHFDGQETDTLRLFQAAGLAPALRHMRRSEE